MAKELRKFLLKFPYLPRSRIIKEGVEEASRLMNLFYFSPSFPWCGGRPFPFSSLLLLWPKSIISWSLKDVAGSRKEKKERKHASLGAWLVENSSSFGSSCAWPKLEGRRKKVPRWFSSWKIVAHTTSEVRRGIR